MGMIKQQKIEPDISMEDVQAGLDWLQSFGLKTFKDFTGEWIEVRCSHQLNLFGDDPEVIPHLIEETV